MDTYEKHEGSDREIFHQTQGKRNIVFRGVLSGDFGVRSVSLSSSEIMGKTLSLFWFHWYNMANNSD